MPWPIDPTGLLQGQAGPDRAAARRAEPDLLPRLLAEPTTRVLHLVGDRTAVEEGPGGVRLALRPPVAGDRGLAFLGLDAAGAAYVLVAGPAGAEPAGEEPGGATLRAVGPRLDPAEASLLATALGLANWHATHPRCPRCGEPTDVVQAGWSRRCPADGSLHFPRTDPAVIMAVVDDRDRLLLARGRGFSAKGMSVLAGFVEPGESLAAAVRREVLEEVGLAVDDVTYLGDQPWPFPSSLMVGFVARAVGGTLSAQEDEIEAVRWFTREELGEAVASGEVLVSSRLSLARHLIEHWYGAPLEAPEVSLRPSRPAT